MTPTPDRAPDTSLDDSLLGRPRRPHVLIIGGGFGGLEAARTLADVDVDVTLLDKRNHHLFQPLLYQVATAGLSGPDIATPIRKLLADQRNARVLLGEALDIDADRRVVETSEGPLAYDHLVIATGVSNNYFGHDEWEAHAPGLKSLDDALEIRRRILLAFEAAEMTDDPVELRRQLTFVVVGGGPTGVEMAGSLIEIATHTLARNFRHFDPADARIVLVEGAPRLLMGFDDALADYARERLERAGVEVRLGKFVEKIDEDGVVVGGERIEARTVVWGAGVGGRRFERTLERADIDRMGRLKVHHDLRVDGYERIFAVGDIARFVVREASGDERPEVLPGVAQVAIQQGKHVAENIARIQRGRPGEPFVYKDLGSMATIGRSAAIAEIGSFKVTGFIAWLLWTFVHIMALVGFRNRAIVLFNWALAYLFWIRGARIILDQPVGEPSPHVDRKALKAGVEAYLRPSTLHTTGDQPAAPSRTP